MISDKESAPISNIQLSTNISIEKEIESSEVESNIEVVEKLESQDCSSKVLGNLLVINLDKKQ